MTTAQAARRETAGATSTYFQPRRLGHVNLVVHDVDRSMEFYKSVVGLEEAYVQPKNRAGFLSNGNTHHDIGMVESGGPLGFGRPPGLNHTAFELENEVDLVHGYERAIGEDVAFLRTVDHDIAHSIYGKDPDGNLYEIYADVVLDWRTARHGVVTKPKPLWKPGMTPPLRERQYHPSPELVRVESAVFHPRRTVSLALVLENFEAGVDYYQRIIGLTLLVGGRDAPFAILGGTLGERNVSLFRTARGVQPGLHHIGYEAWSEQDLDASIARLRDTGSAPTVEIETPLRRAVYIRDPDGIRQQFFVDRGRSAAEWAACDPEAALLLA